MQWRSSMQSLWMSILGFWNRFASALNTAYHPQVTNTWHIAVCLWPLSQQSTMGPSYWLAVIIETSVSLSYSFQAVTVAVQITLKAADPAVEVHNSKIYIYLRIPNLVCFSCLGKKYLFDPKRRKFLQSTFFVFSWFCCPWWLNFLTLSLCSPCPVRPPSTFLFCSKCVSSRLDMPHSSSERYLALQCCLIFRQLEGRIGLGWGEPHEELNPSTIGAWVF